MDCGRYAVPMETIDSTAIPPGRLANARATAVGAGAVSLLLANLGFVYFYFRFDLSLYQVLIVFWVECFWIGVYSALKLVVASLLGDPYANRLATVSRGVSLCISVSAIMMLSSAFLTVFMFSGFALAATLSELSGMSAETLFVDSLGLIVGIAGLLLAAHGVSFIVHFLCQGEFRHARMGTLLLLPFKRCLALLTAIGLAAGVLWILPGFASTHSFVLLLVLLKLAGDLALHRRERRALWPAQAARPPGAPG